MKKMKTELTEAKKQITEMKTRTQDIEEKVKGTDTRVDQTEETLQATQKNQKQDDDRFVMLEMGRASKMLRFQNVPVKEGKDLEILISEALALEIEIDPAEFRQYLEATYRVSTAYLRKNKLPKEINVRFTNKVIRDKVLRISQDKQLIIEDKKINELKQIPWQMRQRRKEYSFLVSLLQQNGISYRWPTPEGLFFRIDTQRYNITFLMKARDFMGENEKNLKIQGKRKKERKPEGRSQEKPRQSSQSESDTDLGEHEVADVPGA